MYDLHDPLLNLTQEERLVAQKVLAYFKSPRMNLLDKMLSAKLIALHDLEQHHFTTVSERNRIAEFTGILDSILNKLHP